MGFYLPSPPLRGRGAGGEGVHCMSSIIELTSGGVRWRLPAELRGVLFGEHGLRLDEWLRTGQARIVKHARHRTVYQVRLPGLHFFLKRNRITDAADRFRARVRPGKSLAEYDRALEVAARHVPTYVPLAAGAPENGPGDTFLLTEALDGTRQLNVFLEQELPQWPEPRRSRVRRHIAIALGRLLAHMHDAGIVQHDLHPGNILIGFEEDEPRLYLVDLQAVRLGPPLGWKASRDNLVVLNRWFILRASRADRLRFWHAYCAARRAHAGRAANGCTCPHRIREMEDRTLRSILGFWRDYDRRCLQTNRRFRRVRAPGVCGHAVTDIDPVALESLLRDPDEPFRKPDVRLLKDSRSSTVAELEMPINGSPQKVIWKRFRVTSWKDPWLALLRPTGALRSWTLGHGLRLRWLPTPRPLLVLHRHRHGLPRDGYILTAKVTDAEELQAVVHGLAGAPGKDRRQKLLPILEEVARLVRDLHHRQVSHRDLKAPNILVVRQPSAPQSASAEPLDHWPLTDSRLWLIDLVGVRCHRRLSRQRMVQNLARLNASFIEPAMLSRTERLRFLLLYLESGLRKVDWKRWWRDIERATKIKIARNARNGRPLH